MIDYGIAWGAPYKDPAWLKKVALAGLWTSLVVTAPAVTGWLLEYRRAVYHYGPEAPLPEWGDFGEMWTKGLAVWLAEFVWVAVLEAAVFIITSVTFGLGSIVSVAGFAVGMFLLVAAMEYALTGDVSAYWSVGRVWQRMKGDTGWVAAYFVAMLAGIAYGVGIGFIAGGIIGLLTFGIGWLYAFGVSGALTGITSSNMIAQWARGAWGGVPAVPAAATVAGYTVPAPAPVAPAPAPAAPAAPAPAPAPEPQVAPPATQVAPRES